MTSDHLPLLSIEGVSKVYGRSVARPGRSRRPPAVDDVSLAISPGESLALVGESGSGKTTLARMATGLVVPTNGRILYSSADINVKRRRHEHLRLRRKVQMVFQDARASTSSRLPIWRVIGEGWSAHPEIVPKARRRERTAELLSMVGLSPTFAEKYSHELSGGQRQRVGIARALALEPELIVCDEPLSALDVSVQAQIVNLFRALQKELALSYLFITHDLSLVRYVADSVAVMRSGQVLESGSVEQVFSSPSSDYTKLLLDSVSSPAMAKGGQPDRATSA
jgi:oligopeptide transport system ATP-binding protein